jgi:hypothetical protein
MGGLLNEPSMYVRSTRPKAHNLRHLYTPVAEWAQSLHLVAKYVQLTRYLVDKSRSSCTDCLALFYPGKRDRLLANL